MSPADSGAGGGLRAIAFADGNGAAWGAAIGDGDRWSLVMEPDGVAGAALQVTEEPDDGWRLQSPDGELSLLALPLDPPAPAPPSAQESDGTPPGAPFVPGEGPELCRVTGTVSGRTVDWRAVRVRMAPARSAKDAPGSARMVAGWFDDGSAVALVAARPRRHDRPDHDAASATLFDPERWLAVTEPRLSTTYDGSEHPARVNLELWIGEGDHEYPRRTAGEAAGAPAQAAGLQVVPLRCHSRGVEGLGVYALATF